MHSPSKDSTHITSKLPSLNLLKKESRSHSQMKETFGHAKLIKQRKKLLGDNQWTSRKIYCSLLISLSCLKLFDDFQNLNIFSLFWSMPSNAQGLLLIAPTSLSWWAQGLICSAKKIARTLLFAKQAPSPLQYISSLDYFFRERVWPQPMEPD